MSDKSYAQQSKSNWIPNPVTRQPSTEELALGCLQRVASGLEEMNKTLSQIKIYLDKISEGNAKVVDAINAQKQIINIKPAVIKS